MRYREWFQGGQLANQDRRLQKRRRRSKAADTLSWGLEKRPALKSQGPGCLGEVLQCQWPGGSSEIRLFLKPGGTSWLSRLAGGGVGGDVQGAVSNLWLHL